MAAFKPCITLSNLDAVSGQIMAMTIGEEQPNRPPSISSMGSTSSGPDGFKNRKVEIKDGYLIVAEASSPCTSVLGNTMDGWENVYMKHRDDIVDENGFINTPLHVIRTLAKDKKEKVHIEHFILKDPINKSQKIYRVDILIGSIRGVGLCTRKQLARQLAAIDVYEKLQLQEGEIQRPTPIPRCGILPGWRVDKLVYKELFNNVCKNNNLERPKFQMVFPPDNKVGKSTAICRVGDVVTKSENDLPWLAKKLAAKEMYETITQSEFPLKATVMGAEVIGFPEMKLLGFDPKITSLKRKWMMEHRIEGGQVVFLPNEPDDGEMNDIEEEAEIQRSKRLKTAQIKETLIVTFNKDPGNNESASSTHRIVTSASTSDAKRANTIATITLPKIKYEQSDLGEEGYGLVLQEDDYDDELFG